MCLVARIAKMPTVYFNLRFVTVFLTLSSPVMPFGIILLIMFFICCNFGGLERVNPFQPSKIVAYEGQN
jgi:hypothetical protein